MPDLEDQLRQQNPWWFGQGMGVDLHLRRLARSRFSWDPAPLTEIPLRFEDTHTLRGPRQAGKTTTIKRMIQRLVEKGETRVLYASFDVALPATVIGDIVRAAKRIHPTPAGPWYIFFDEITALPDWQLGIKSAWDAGITSDDALLLTSSSAHDLKRGAERLPGRRGKGRDYLQLPMAFRDYCIAAHAIRFDDEPILAEEFLTRHGERVAARLTSQSGALRIAFSQYLRTGGFPAAVNDALDHPARDASAETLQMLWDIIAGDVTRSQRDRTAALKLLQVIGTSLGSPISWLSAARSMGVDSPNTAREYAEYLAETFVLLAVYYWDIGRNSLEPSRQRKLYVVDPILASIPRALIPGTPVPGDDGMIESAVASGLFRAAAQTLIQASAVPGAIGYWRSSNDREIDFVIPRVSDLDRPRLPVEVKGDNLTGIAGARSAIRRRFDSGVVLSRTVFDWREDAPVIPVWAFLAGLREQPMRAITFA
jgi:predicted AAA+ superfamily ATPase